MPTPSSLWETLAAGLGPWQDRDRRRKLKALRAAGSWEPPLPGWILTLVAPILGLPQAPVSSKPADPSP